MKKLTALEKEMLVVLRAYVDACKKQGIRLGPITGDAEAVIAKAAR